MCPSNLITLKMPGGHWHPVWGTTPRYIQKDYPCLDIAMLQEHLTDVYRHLTNYSINKGAENFQENQRVQADNYGHKWSLSALNRHLRCFSLMEELVASGVFYLEPGNTMMSYVALGGKQRCQERAPENSGGENKGGNCSN